MSNFSLDTKARAWMVTVQVENMKKTGLSEEEYRNPEFLCDFLKNHWDESGNDRKSACAVCESADGLYHAHMALYGNSTTLRCVAKTMFQSHTEPQLGGKKELRKYLLKEPPYAEKDEKVLIAKGIENISESKDDAPSLDKVQDLIAQGYTPEQIFDLNIRYRRFEKIIKSAYLDKRINDTPLVKDINFEWHCGEAGTGKSYTYIQMCKKHGEKNIYFCTDLDTGGFDLYAEMGAPPILFIDELKNQFSYFKLLQITDCFSRAQTHCRYGNTFNLWTTVIVTSIYAPEEIYGDMVDHDKRARDTFEQLRRRISKVVYHYIENDEYKTFAVSGADYISYEDLKQKALGGTDGFIPVKDGQTPFK